MSLKKSSEIKYERFSVSGNWAHRACLGGIRIKDCDQLVIKWLDGTTQRVTPRVSESTERISDMGQPCDIPVSRAWISIDHNGSVFEVSLTGIKSLEGYFITDVSDRKPI